MVDEDVVVAGGADYAVDRFVELLVAHLGGMCLSRLLASHRHCAGSIRSILSPTLISGRNSVNGGPWLGPNFSRAGCGQIGSCGGSFASLG